ncbi:FAD-linked oxidoreductase, partial [Kocuria oceani]
MGIVDRGEHDDEVARALEALRTRLTGTLVEPDDPLYDEARRVWNGMIDVRPRAVARAGSVADIDPVLATAQHT